MVATYRKASSYADAGTVRLVVGQGKRKIDESVDFSVTLVRPNKIRMHVYQAMVVCDGQQLRAAIEDLPGQVLAKEAPKELTMESIHADRLLARVLSGGLTGPAPQLVLLLEDDSFEAITRNAEVIVLGKPETLAGRECHRVEIKRAYGTTTLWIDRESHVLRRIVFPTDELRQELARSGPVATASLVAEFAGAELDGEVGAKAFEFETPAGAELVKFFAPPDPAQLLAKKAPDFKFVDLAGKLVTPGSLVGKITVLEFWYTECPACRISLPSLDKVREQYKDNAKLSFFAVSVDEPEVENEQLRRAFEELGVRVPILRDLEQNMGMLFNTEGTPTRFIIDAKGVVQFYEEGADPAVVDPAAVLSQQLEKLLAGEDIYQGPLEAYRVRLKEYERRLESSADAKSPGQPAVQVIEIPRAEIAKRSEPKTFKLTRLWEYTGLTSPGNILVLGSADGPSQGDLGGPAANGRPRLLVVDAARSVAEIGLDGKLVARHPLDIEPVEAVSNLRTAVGADHRRYFAAFSFAQQRFHLFDQDWKLLVSFPPGALENNHPGIADVQLADLEHDGNLEAYVGYRDVVGLQQVSLEGKRLWSNRSIIDVAQIAVGGPDAQGARYLVCTSSNGALTTIDSKGQRLGQITLPGRVLHKIVAADLDGDGTPQWCGLAVREDGRNVAVGLDLAGKELWSCELPMGVHRQQIEPIVAGRLSPATAGQWLLPGADGSIQVLSADGKPLDSFQWGAELAGLATTELDGRPVLIVSTPGRPDGRSPGTVEAWKVE